MFRLTVLLFFVVLCTTGESYQHKSSCAKNVKNLEKKLDRFVSAYKSSGSCPHGWSTYAGSRSCYRFVNTAIARWKDARKACLSIGGDLVKIDSLRENTYVTYLARTFSYKSAFMWIGLHRDVSKQFVWVDGSEMSGQYTRWYSGEPNGSVANEDCVFLYLYVSKRISHWNDGRCDLSGKGVFMCEKSKQISK